MVLDDIEQVRREHQALCKAAGEAAGRRAAALARMEDEFGVKTVEDAEALLAKLRKKEKAALAADFAAKDAYKAMLAEHGPAIEQFLEDAR